MVLLKDFLPGTNVVVDYFGKRKAPNTFFQGVDLSGYYAPPVDGGNGAAASAEPLQDVSDGGAALVLDGGADHVHQRSSSSAPSRTSGPAVLPSSLYQHVPVEPSAPVETLFVISHFHSDHFMGMELNWRPERALASRLSKVHATKTTAILLKNCFRVSESLVVGHDYLVPEIVDGLAFVEDASQPAVAGDGQGLGFVSQTSRRAKYCLCFVSANHCPGSSVVLLFSLAVRKLFVNTGDLRVWDGMEGEIAEGLRRMTNLIFNTTTSLPSGLLEHKALSALLHPPVAMMFLDFTWAHELFDQIPTKQSAIDKILRLIERTSSSSGAPGTKPKKVVPPPVLLFRSSGLGDEEILQALMKKFAGYKFVFMASQRLLELCSVNVITEENGLRKRCVLFDDLPPEEVVQQRFFVGNSLGVGFAKVKGILGGLGLPTSLRC